MSISVGSIAFLKERPSFITPEMRKDHLHCSVPELARIFERLIEQHGPHPYLLVALGNLIRTMEGGNLPAVDLFRQASATLAELGLKDEELTYWISSTETEELRNAEEVLELSRNLNYRQNWKSTRDHKFPLNYPQAPPGHEDLKEVWSTLFSPGSELLLKYLNMLAIETNHVESTFLLTDGSTQDLIRKGIVAGDIKAEAASKIQDSQTIQSIITDTLAAYELLAPVLNESTNLTPARVRDVHARLMRTCKFGRSYIPPGQTRTKTKQTVHITGAYSIQCCPYPEVDDELEYICKMGKQYNQNFRNPFASASWLHLILARCHPFNDGNGRTTRLIASLPLLLHGYPPISVTLPQRTQYYEAINQAFDGNHGPFIDCILAGMWSTIKQVQEL